MAVALNRVRDSLAGLVEEFPRFERSESFIAANTPQFGLEFPNSNLCPAMMNAPCFIVGTPALNMPESTAFSVFASSLLTCYTVGAYVRKAMELQSGLISIPTQSVQ